MIGIEGEPWDPDVDGDLEDNLRIYQPNDKPGRDQIRSRFGFGPPAAGS